MDLNKVNLNLLIHFDHLVTEGSVTKAAEKVCLSQTAMSRILSKLREVFNDPLFIRDGYLMKPTQKALEIHVKVKEAIASIDLVFSSDIFNPLESDHTFRLALSSHGESYVLPRLCKYLSTNAPNITIKSMPISEKRSIGELFSYGFDLVIAPEFFDENINDVVNVPILEEQPIIVMSQENPLNKKTLTLGDYLSASHIAVALNYYEEHSFIDEAIHELGKKRNVRAYVPNLITALQCICSSDYIGTLPMNLSTAYKSLFDLSIHPLPFNLGSKSIKLYYPTSNRNYQPLQWLINTIKTII